MTMKLTNARDISTQPGDVGAGFQWEFVCDSCGESWKSPFKPYRIGQVSGLFRRFGFIFGEFYKVGTINEMIGKVGRASGAGVDSGKGAKQAAQEEAFALARTRYHHCRGCNTIVCDNCWEEDRELCIKCVKQAAQSNGSYGASSGAVAAAMACPNCQTPSQGGRFCHECGFDMASTHKSCPSCGATMARQARFCVDCGHGF